MDKMMINGQEVKLGGGSNVTFDDTMSTNDEGITSVANPMRGILTQAEYDALPEDEKSVGTYIISDDQNGSSGSGGMSGAGEIYSTEETRIGTWIDGKPLYRKVVSNLTAPSNNTTVEHDVGLNGVISFAVNVRAIVYYSSPTLNWVQTNYSTSGGVFVAGMYESGKLWVNTTNVNIYGKPMTVILEYTKSTDEGSTPPNN